MRLVCFPLLALLLATSAANSADDVEPAGRAPVGLETAHYRIHAEATPAETAEMGRVLEAAWGELAQHFGRTPRLARDERLIVRFLGTRAAWEEALRADGISPPTDAGGYYAPGTKTIYVFRQPTVYFTRVLLVHEATHQFHYLARTNNRQPAAAWYREGVAEFHSWHAWDGERLSLRMVPPISLKDYPAVSLAAVSADAFDLDGVLEGRVWPGYPVAWALFRYIATGRDGKPLKGYETFCRKMDAGGAAKSLFPRCFGPVKRFRPRFLAWLEASQQPWIWLFNEWDARGPRSLCGFADVVTCCRLRERAERLTATLEVPGEGPWRGGLLLGYVAADDYLVALVDGGGRLHVDRRLDGAWHRIADEALALPTRGADLALEAFRGADGVSVRVGEARFGPYSAPGGTLGLAADASRIVFRDLAWE